MCVRWAALLVHTRRHTGTTQGNPYVNRSKGSHAQPFFVRSGGNGMIFYVLYIALHRCISNRDACRAHTAGCIRLTCVQCFLRAKGRWEVRAHCQEMWAMAVALKKKNYRVEPYSKKEHTRGRRRCAACPVRTAAEMQRYLLLRLTSYG